MANISSGEAKGDSQADTVKKVPTSSANNPSAGELYNRIKQVSSAAQGRVGVAATVLETGESVAFNGDQHFPMQSVYKFPIGMAVLAQVDKGKLKLAQRVHVEKSDFVSKSQHSLLRDSNPQGLELSLTELLKYMVSESDGTACGVLFRLIARPEVVTEYLHNLGIKGIVVANTEKEIGQDKSVQYRNWATPEAVVAMWDEWSR